jgi:PHP family Zn ribbon phosphoesterase
MSPEERKKVNNICPICGKPLTIGVLSRVEKLSDRPKDEVPENTIPFRSLVPLGEIIAESFGCQVKTKAVEEEYQKLISQFPNEFYILLDASFKDLQRASTEKIADGIIRMREGKVILEPGYDGEYGKVKVFSDKELKDIAAQEELF